MPFSKVRILRGGRDVDAVIRRVRDSEKTRWISYRGRMVVLSGHSSADLDTCLQQHPHLVDRAVPRGEPPLPGELRFDADQRRVIEAPADARIRVEAGPGTGKTAVTLERVRYLVEKENIPASQILLMSFTRTATRELVKRIGQTGAAIRTLDSFAGEQVALHDERRQFDGDHDQTIARYCELLQNPHVVRELRGRCKHLLVDEAQDLVGARAELILSMIQTLRCGITVLGDSAQYIYDFTLRDRPERGLGQTLPRRLDGFTEVTLSEIYRTDCPVLRGLFRETRGFVLQNTADPENKLDEVLQQIRDHATGPPLPLEELRGRNDILRLHRTRRAALEEIRRLGAEGIPFRIRMGGEGDRLVPWLGLALAEQVESRLTRADFNRLWKRHCEHSPFVQTDCASAWQALMEVCGDRQQELIDLFELRRYLAPPHRPPEQLCIQEVGLAGPIVGTIHGSKGREADHVHLQLASEGLNRVQDDLDELSRLFFVAATRARRSLTVCDGHRDLYVDREQGRAYEPPDRQRNLPARLEVGFPFDLDGESMAGREAYQEAAPAEDIQQALRQLRDLPQPVTGKLVRGGWYRLCLEGDENRCLGHLSARFMSDLDKVRYIRKLGGRAKELRNLYLVGLRTIVLPPPAGGAGALTSLHPPYDRSGILLAPEIRGFSGCLWPR